jgi:hypothetical protein
MVVEEEIARLEVAMDDAMVVGVLQGRRDLHGVGGRLRPGERSPLLEAIFECPMVEQLHCIEELPIEVASPKMPHDMRVIEPFHERDFSLETTHHVGVPRNARVEEFNGDRVVEIGARGAKHHPDCPSADALPKRKSCLGRQKVKFALIHR